MKNQLKNDWRLIATAALLTTLIPLAVVRATGQSIQDPPFGRPDVVVDLASREGVELVQGQWRYHDVKVVDADSHAVGPDLKPSGAAAKTYDYEPHAGVASSTIRNGRQSTPRRLTSAVLRRKSASTGIASRLRSRKELAG